MLGRPNDSALRLVLTAPALVLASCPAAVWAQDADPFDDGDPIVVAAALGGGSVQTDVAPEIRVERVAIRALGANSLAEVVETFAAQSRSPRGDDDDPILLLNGRRIGDRREIEQLPPEAILRIEIFPEEVALQFGYPPGRRVVNVILRPRYNAALLHATFALPLKDGRAIYNGKAGIVRQSDTGRLNLDLSYRRQDPVADPAAGEGDDIRWRLPRTQRGSLNGVWSRELGTLTLTASANARRETEDRKLGRAAGATLRRRDIEEQAGIGLTLAGKDQHWNWTAIGAIDWRRDRTATRDPMGGLRPVAGYSMRGARGEAKLDFSAGGPLLAIPAGELRATFAGGAALRRGETGDRWATAPDTEIRQASAYLSGAFDVPLAASGGAVLFGDVRLDVYDEGTLVGHGLGLRGSPLAGLSFSLTWRDDRALPEFSDLADLPLLTPNWLTYDWAVGIAAYADRREGGNPALTPSSTRTLALRVRFEPVQTRDLALSLDLSDQAIRDGVGGPLGPTPQVEAAFPERFARDGAGLLAGFDARAANIAHEDRSVLRWGLNWNAPIGRAAPGSLEVPQMQLAAFHSWTLENKARLRPGSAEIDLLGGAAIGDSGGTSRHRIELQLAYASPDAGIRLTGDWRSATSVAGPGPHRLDFGRRFDLGLRLFLNLNAVRERIDLGSGRIYLSFDNILGGRTRIRDAAGSAVDHYRGGDEETGSAVWLSFREFFY